MDIKQILTVIKELSQSQGFYGRLLRDIKGLNYEQFNEFKDYMESQNFKDSLDVIMFFET